MGLWDAVKGIGGALLPLAGPIGGVASTLIDAVTQRHANEANAANADKQMQFQAEQTSTQYQRGVADLKAAGLNPAMAYKGASDAAASGTSAIAQPVTSNTTSKFATALDTYNAMANGTAQRDLLRAQSNAADQQARLTQIQGTVLAPEGILSQDASQGGYREKYFRTRMAELAAREFTAGSTPERFRADMSSIGAGTAKAQQDAAESRTRSILNEQEFQTEWFRKHMAPYINNTAAGMKAAGDAARLITAGRRNVFDLTGR